MQEENAKLRVQLQRLQLERDAEKELFESKISQERDVGLQHADTVQQRSVELDAMRQNLVKLTRQLDEEVARRDQMQADSQFLERRVQEATGNLNLAVPPKKSRAEEHEPGTRERGVHVSTKLMRVVDQWMRHKDLQQALLRGASINDQSLSTIVQALTDCPSLQTVDLSMNLLSMDACSDLCQLITTAPNLSFVSLADNLLSLRSVGYFMTAVMERQNSKNLMPLDLLDLQGNEGLIAAASLPVPESLMKLVNSSLNPNMGKLPPTGTELVAQVMRALWRFLHDTGHPQVQNTSTEEITFNAMDKITLRKMENALSKILLKGVEDQTGFRPVTANLALAIPAEDGFPNPHLDLDQSGQPLSITQSTSSLPKPLGTGVGRGLAATASNTEPAAIQQDLGGTSKPRADAPDPFADLKAAYEPPKEKLKTFNLKQIVTRNGTVLMNMLERLLETTDIDAQDVETLQTLLEYACSTGNMGLAKLCYRRGAKLSARTRKGDTAFNIVTRNRRYDLMEFLHTYGVKVNSCDKDGMTAMHVSAQNDDVDAICRLVEWGADVNIRDNGKRTPIHVAAGRGNMNATMLLLEVGADMNARDAKLYTAAAHANMNSHFALFDRLTALGGRRHGQILDMSKSASTKKLGELVVSSGVLKSSSLGRIGKISVNGMPGPILNSISQLKDSKKK